MAGYIISVIGGKGGVGKSFFASNLALSYSAESRGRSLVLDFDQKSCGDQNIIMGIKSKKNLKELSEFNGAIDPRTLQKFMSPTIQNVNLISMPTDTTSAQAVSPEGMGKLLKAITNIYPVTVIDLGSDLTPLALKALEYSTVIFMVTTPDILAVNQTKRLYQELVTMLFPKDMMQVILNQYQKGHPVSPEVVGKQIGKPVFGLIPKDEQSNTVSLNNSKPIMVIAKASSYAKGITDIARKIIQKNVLKSLSRLNKPKDAKANKDKGSSGGEGKTNPWVDLKARIHKSLIEEMDLKKSSDDKDESSRTILKEQTRKVVVDILGKEDTTGVVNNREDMAQIVKEVLDEALGLGPLEDLLANSSVTEIMVNGPNKIFFEQEGKIKRSEVVFTNDRQVLNVIERIVAPIGRRIDEKTPYVDARLRDGSRVHAIIAPSAIDGCTITIRKFPENRLTYKDLIKFDSCSQGMADFLRLAVEAHKNIIISGGTGSGKTTLINILAGFIPSNERIITVEDSAELSLPQEHVVRLETRPPSLDGEGEIDIRLLVKQTLRMRPDRIVVGECRGGEALDMLQAMNTGHDGSMTTVHSNSPRDCIGRLETLVQYSGAGLSAKAIREMIASAIHIIVQQTRLDDGSRRILNITEVGGIQGEVITLQDIFEYRQEGMDKKGKIIGKYQSSGFIPKFVEVLERKGYTVPRGLFTSEG
jgi:pilus assembly protein CpaF